MWIRLYKRLSRYLRNIRTMAVKIIGQGVAGTLLAFELEKRNIDFAIIDSGVNHSSSVAAGIMNPVVFRRLTKTWMIDSCWDLAISKYREIEHKLGVSFLYEKPMRRLFASDQEYEFWKEKTLLPEFKKYISFYPDTDRTPYYANNTNGNGLVKSVYHVDVKEFLSASKAYFERQKRIILDNVDYFELSRELEEETSDFIIFCQGYQNFENPFFKNLPVQTTKGQILTIKNESFSQEELLNRKCFMLPLGNHLFRVGATYEWENISLETTEAAKEQLLEKLSSLVQEAVEVVSQEAGIRPTTPDRRPILGQHPTYSRMYVLNGLGTKGYLLAPWCVNHLAEHIFDGAKLKDEVDLKRFKVL